MEWYNLLLVFHPAKSTQEQFEAFKSERLLPVAARHVIEPLSRPSGERPKQPRQLMAKPLVS